MRVQTLLDEPWGRKRIILKAGGEHAINESRNNIRELRTAETIIEAPARGDSKSNGRAKDAAQEFEGLMRTWSVASEDKYGCTRPTQHPIMKFFAEHTGGMHSNCCKPEEDGMTLDKKIRGKDPQAKAEEKNERHGREVRGRHVGRESRA